MITLIRGLLLSLLPFFINFPVVFATGITTDAATTYTISDAGDAKVSYRITLTNNTASVFVSEYLVDINTNHLKNLSVTDGAGNNLPYTLDQSEATTFMAVSFNQPVVGKDKSQTINITYTSTDISQAIGNILHLNIPPIMNPEKYHTHQVSIIVPVRFGKPSILSSPPTSLNADQALTQLLYTKEQLTGHGLQAIFGEKQDYDVTLRYELYNPTITPVETQIALPPDTNYQQIFIKGIEPQPLSLTPDHDGNWLATFKIQPKQTLSVTANLAVRLFAQPIRQSVFSHLSPEAYLGAQKYWEIDSDLVKERAAKTTTAREIYDYLVGNFAYNYARIDNQTTTRLGAEASLTQPDNSLCLEFSDTFIALARANQIPARLLTGYALSQNQSLKPVSLVQDTLHAWPDFYNGSIWQAIDPTWGSTTGGINYFDTLDFNHIVFSIMGSSSEQPFPAGYFQDPSRSVSVTIATEEPVEIVDFEASLILPLLTKLGLTQSAKIQLVNRSNIAFHKEPVRLTTPDSFNIPILLPSDSMTFPVKLPSNTNQGTLSLSIYGQNYDLTFQRLDPGIAGIAAFASTTLIAGGIGIFTYRARSLLVSKK
jgi:hypothetical protein